MHTQRYIRSSSFYYIASLLPAFPNPLPAAGQRCHISLLSHTAILLLILKLLCCWRWCWRWRSGYGEGKQYHEVYLARRAHLFRSGYSKVTKALCDEWLLAGREMKVAIYLYQTSFPLSLSLPFSFQSVLCRAAEAVIAYVSSDNHQTKNTNARLCLEAWKMILRLWLAIGPYIIVTLYCLVQLDRTRRVNK